MQSAELKRPRNLVTSGLIVCLFMVLVLFLSTGSRAETSGTIDNAAPQYIKANSDPIVVLNLTLHNNSAGNGNDLKWVNVTVTNVTDSGVYFDPNNHLASLTNNVLSGMAFYKETGGGSGFQAGTDSIVSFTENPWTGSDPIWYTNMTGITGETLPDTPLADPNYYIVIRTSATILNGAKFNVSIDAGNINATYGNIPATSVWSLDLLADTEALSSSVSTSGSYWKNTSFNIDWTASDNVELDTVELCQSQIEQKEFMNGPFVSYVCG